MRVGTLCFATDQGLSILAKSFYDNGVVTDVMVVRHGKRPEHDEWYPDSRRISSLTLQGEEIRAFCSSMDLMLFFETPFDWALIDWCRASGKKTALMVMFECMPKVLPANPDLILCPSLLDLSYYPNLQTALARNDLDSYARSVYLPVPVDVPWRQRVSAEVFVHNAGHGGLKGRNGTRELLEAIPFVKSAARLLIRTQGPANELMNMVKSSMNVDFEYGTVPYDSLYQKGDVFVFPEKFNGLSLPLQEARAAGMLVMGTDRFPMNMWLPREPLIPVSETRKNNVSPRCNEFDEAVVNPREIAAKIDEWYGRDITQYSMDGKRWAEENSWAVLKPKYMEVLENLVKS